MFCKSSSTFSAVASRTCGIYPVHPASLSKAWFIQILTQILRDPQALENSVVNNKLHIRAEAVGGNPTGVGSAFTRPLYRNLIEPLGNRRGTGFPTRLRIAA